MRGRSALPEQLKQILSDQLERIKIIHEQDLKKCPSKLYLLA